MSSQTSPISNRLRISRGWNNSYFPQSKNEYSRNISLWLKLFLLIKVYLEIKNFKLVSCELKFTNNNRKLLFLNLFKCLKEKKKRKNKSKIQYTFQWPLQRLKNKKAIFLLYKNLKKIKKITNLKYSSSLFYKSKNIWLKKSPLLKKLLINKFQRAIIKFAEKNNEKKINSIKIKQSIFEIVPTILLSKKKQIQLLEKKYEILAKLYKQIFFSKIKKQPSQFQNSYWLLARFLSFKLIDLKNKINKLSVNINHLLKRKNLYKKKKTFYFIQKIRLRVKNKIKKFVYLTRNEKIHNLFYSKLLIKHNIRSIQKKKIILKRFNNKKNKINLSKKIVKFVKKKIHKTKKKHIHFILKKRKKQIYLFNLFFKYLKNKQINIFNHAKKLSVLKFLMADYIGYYSLKTLNKKIRNKNLYTFLTKHIVQSKIKNLFNLAFKKKKNKTKYLNNIVKKIFLKRNKNKFSGFFHRQTNKHVIKLIKLSFYSIKKRINIKKLKRKKTKQFWQIFKKWNKKNKTTNSVKIHIHLNKKARKYKPIKKNFKHKFNWWKKKKNKLNKISKVSKKTRKKYFIYKNILVQFQLQTLIKEYIYKYFQIYCIVHTIDIISKFKNSKLFYLALTKFYGPKKEYWKTKKINSYLFLSKNNGHFIKIQNRLKKWSLINKKLKKKKIKNKWKIISKKIKKTKYSTKFKVIKTKKSIKNLQWISNQEKKTMYQNIRNKALLARFLPILALLAKNLDPRLLAEQIARELEETKNHWPVIYTIRNILRTYQIKKMRGYRIGIYGKINSSERTRLFYINSGRIPIQTFSEQVNYANTQSRARAGTFGIKVWIF